MTRKLVLFCAILFGCTVPCNAQQQADRITARGQVTAPVFANTATVTIVGATPSVSSSNVFRTGNGGSTTVTNFLNGVDSQNITISCGDANTTIANNAKNLTASGSNFVCTLNATIQFVFSSGANVWIQSASVGPSVPFPSTGITLLNAQANTSAITGNNSPQVFYTYTLPANQIANLRGFRVTAGWNHSTGSAAIGYNLSLNGLALLNPTLNNQGGLMMTLTVLNTGTTTGTSTGVTYTGAAITNQVVTVGSGLTWSSPQVIQITFNVANTDQITPIQWIVEAIQ
jgi:hypothetical protein